MMDAERGFECFVAGEGNKKSKLRVGEGGQDVALPRYSVREF